MSRLRRWKKREFSLLIPSQRLRAGLKYVAPTALERGRAGTARRKGGGHGIPAAARNLRRRAPTRTAAEGGTFLRRDLSRRGGVRRVRRASGAPGGRGCAENPGPDGRPCACCIRDSRKPGCGRNCVRIARVARRDRGTARGRECGGGSKSKRCVRDREWLCGAPRFSRNPWPQGQRREALPQPGRHH